MATKPSEIGQSDIGVRWISKFLISKFKTRVIDAQLYRSQRSVVLGFLNLEIIMIGTSRVWILAFRDLAFDDLSCSANLDMKLPHHSDLAVWHSPDSGVHRFTVLRLIDSNVRRFEFLWSWNTLFC